MQILTAQYPSMYTRKFRLAYTDWQPNNNKFAYKKIFDLPKGNQIVGVMVSPTVQFIASGLTAAFISIGQISNPLVAGSLAGAYIRTRVSSPPTDWLGALQMSDVRSNPANSVLNIINNKLNNTEIAVWLELTGTSVINNLTAGSVDIWVISMRIS